MGCWGGSMERDGQEGISNPAANLGNAPIELMEARLPVEITCYGFVENSGGPGRHRGGVALKRGYRLLADEGDLIMRSDRRSILPYGLAGGLPGTPSWNLINPGPHQTILPVCPMKSTPMRKDDVFLHIQAGAGGFGDPLERDPEKVLMDVSNELMTTDYAADVYGVIFTEDSINAPKTQSRREYLRLNESHKQAYIQHFSRMNGVRDNLKDHP